MRITRSTHRNTFFLILVLGIIIFVWQLGSTGLVDETPPLFAAASRAMHITGNWLTPKVNGLERFDKPPLVYWLMGIFYALPANESWDQLGTWAARLPSALSSLLMMLLLGDTALRWPSNNISNNSLNAINISLAFSLSPLVLIWSRLAVSDALLCSTLGVSLLLMWRAYAREDNLFFPYASWIFLGLAVLTKGPVALILSGLTILLFSLVQKNILSILVIRLKPVKGLLLSALIFLPWYLLQIFFVGKGFWENFWGYHNFQRYLTVVNSHNAPWWFFGLMMIISSLPFTPLLFLGLAKFFTFLFKSRMRAEIQPKDSLFLFACCWLISVFVFFSLSATKLPSYWLPACPAAAIIIGYASIQFSRKSTLFYISWIFVALINFSLAIIFYQTPNWINIINDPGMPQFSNALLEKNLHLNAYFVFLFSSLLVFIFLLIKIKRVLLFLQIPMILFQLYFIIPLWELVDNNRQLPIRNISRMVINNSDNEQLAMVGLKKPSLHFYTNQIVMYEADSDVSLINLSERLIYDKREVLDSKMIMNVANNSTFLLVIEEKISNNEIWKELNSEQLAHYGVYKLWRVKINNLKEVDEKLRLKGLQPNWRDSRSERY